MSEQSIPFSLQVDEAQPDLSETVPNTTIDIEHQLRSCADCGSTSLRARGGWLKCIDCGENVKKINY